MLCHPDLFAFDAKYHRSCYLHYVSERNIRAARSKNESESNFSVYDLAFKELTVELSNSIFFKSEDSHATERLAHTIS